MHPCVGNGLRLLARIHWPGRAAASASFWAPLNDGKLIGNRHPALALRGRPAAPAEIAKRMTRSSHLAGFSTALRGRRAVMAVERPHALGDTAEESGASGSRRAWGQFVRVSRTMRSHLTAVSRHEIYWKTIAEDGGPNIPPRSQKIRTSVCASDQAPLTLATANQRPRFDGFNRSALRCSILPPSS